MKRSFTLIELLIVISIITLLTALRLFALGTGQIPVPSGPMANGVLPVAASYGGGLAVDYFDCRFIFVWNFIFTLLVAMAVITVVLRLEKPGGMHGYIPPEINGKE